MYFLSGILVRQLNHPDLQMSKPFAFIDILTLEVDFYLVRY